MREIDGESEFTLTDVTADDIVSVSRDYEYMRQRYDNVRKLDSVRRKLQKIYENPLSIFNYLCDDGDSLDDKINVLHTYRKVSDELNV